MSAPAEQWIATNGVRPDLPDGTQLVVRWNSGTEIEWSVEAFSEETWQIAKSYRLAAAQPEAKQCEPRIRVGTIQTDPKTGHVIWIPAGGEAQPKPFEPHPFLYSSGGLGCGLCGKLDVEEIHCSGSSHRGTDHADAASSTGERHTDNVEDVASSDAAHCNESYLPRQNADYWLALRGRQAWPETVRPVLEGFPLNAWRWK